MYTQTEIMTNKSDIIIKNRKEKTCILIDVAIPAGCRKETKIQDFMYTDTANVEHEVYDCGILSERFWWNSE